MEENKIKEKVNYKFEIIKNFYKSNKSIRQFCKENNLKKSNLSRWLKNFNDKGYEGLFDESKRPKKI